MQEARLLSPSRPSSSTISSAFNHLFPNAPPPNTPQYVLHLLNTSPCPSALETTLSPLPPSLISATLHLLTAPSATLHFFNLTQKLNFTHPISDYNRVLHNLCTTKQPHLLNSALHFILSIPRRSKGAIKIPDTYFNLLITSFGDAGLVLDSLRVFLVMKKNGVSPSVYTFNSLFLVLLKEGRGRKAEELYEEMLRTFGVKPDLSTFNILIAGFCRNGRVDEGYRFFKEMERFGLEGDLVTYNALVDGLCRVGRMEVARNVVKGMGRKGLGLTPNVVTYTTLIRGYCGRREVEEAWGVFEEMRTRGVRPNGVTCNALILGLCEARRIDRVRKVFERSDGFEPDTCTFNILMKAHCDNGNLDEAKKVFDSMRGLNVQQDSASYSILIRGFCQRGFFGRAEVLLDELLRKEVLLREDALTPLVAAYNLVFEYLCKSGKTRKAEILFRELMGRGGKAGARAFETLIMGHCLEGAYEAGYELLVLMQSRKFVPGLKIYESLIDGLLKTSEFILAFITFENMLKHSYRPATSTYHSILAGLLKNGPVREAGKLMMLMLKKQIRPTLSLSTDTLKLLFKNDLTDRGYQTYKRLHESGYTVKMEELVTFLCQERKFIEAYQLLLHGIIKDQSANLNTCSMVITGLCEISRVSEAFQLYYEVIDLRIPGQLSCLEDLKIALQAEGRLKEAKFLAKRMVN